MKISDSLGNEDVAKSSDYFQALAEIRKRYHRQKLLLNCNGSCIDVFPGGLNSESSLGELAYLFDESSGIFKVVNIFDIPTHKHVVLSYSYDEQKNSRRTALQKHFLVSN